MPQRNYQSFSPCFFLFFFFKVQEFCLISVVSSHTSCLHVCYFCVDKEEEIDRSCAEQESEES